MAQFSGSHSPAWHPHTMSQLGSCNCFLSSFSSPLPSTPLPSPCIPLHPRKTRSRPSGTPPTAGTTPCIYPELCLPALSPIKSQFWDFAGGPVVMNPSANARDTGLIPGLGRPPHAVGQLSLCALEPVLCNKRSHHNERSVHCDKRSPCSLQLEEARMQWWRPRAGKKNVSSSTCLLSFENFSLQRSNSLPCFKISCLLNQSISIKLCFSIYHLQTKKGKRFLYGPSPFAPLRCVTWSSYLLSLASILPPPPRLSLLSSGSSVISFLWLSHGPLSTILQRGPLSAPWNTLLPDGSRERVTKATLGPRATPAISRMSPSNRKVPHPLPTSWPPPPPASLAAFYM